MVSEYLYNVTTFEFLDSLLPEVMTGALMWKFDLSSLVQDFGNEEFANVAKEMQIKGSFS